VLEVDVSGFAIGEGVLGDLEVGCDVSDDSLLKILKLAELFKGAGCICLRACRDRLELRPDLVDGRGAHDVGDARGMIGSARTRRESRKLRLETGAIGQPNKRDGTREWSRVEHQVKRSLGVEHGKGAAIDRAIDDVERTCGKGSPRGITCDATYRRRGDGHAQVVAERT
jgi:hypothetical protein